MSSDLLFRILSGFAVMIITFSVKHRSHCLQMLIVTVAVCLVLILVLLVIARCYAFQHIYLMTLLVFSISFLM